MRWLALLAVGLLLFGCSQNAEQVKEKPESDDLEVSIIVGENYSAGEPIAFQLRTSNYSIIYMNRSGGYSMKGYPSVWICRYVNESECENIEYRWMRGFSMCEGGVVRIDVPPESYEVKAVWPAERYDLLLLWDQKDWKETVVQCGGNFARARQPEQVPPGNYSVSFVYWVSWDERPRSVSADFSIR